LSSTTELEGLLKEREQLTRTLQAIVNEEKHLGQELRIVQEKIAVAELREKIKAKRAVVEQLRYKVTELKKRLNAHSLKVRQNVAASGGQQPKPKYPQVQVQKTR
jgi:predicted  nucleic acid-binding Zn-ribbon protein